MSKKYKFYKKIKPGAKLWCVSMQVTLTFDEEVYIGVVEEHTTWATSDSKVFYGNIFHKGYECGKDIEFEVWEETSTIGERLDKLPPSMPLYYMDFK